MNITLPLTKEKIKSLNPGEIVYLSGAVYTARDAAHKKITETLRAGAVPPFPLRDAAIYYCGPTDDMRAAGPTTSARMDAYTPALLERGVSVFIGKGARSPETTAAIKKHGAVYFTAFGGAGAYYGDKIISHEVVAYPELLAEAVRLLIVKDFPVIVNE